MAICFTRFSDFFITGDVRWTGCSTDETVVECTNAVSVSVDGSAKLCVDEQDLTSIAVFTLRREYIHSNASEIESS